jgi:DNA-binding protein HU-beta
MADLPVFSPSDLHRMVPSDLAEMAKHLSMPVVADGISRAFADYLTLLQKPGAVELDDVVRIAVQLDSIGFWEKIPPENFIGDIGSRLDKDVLAQLCELLGVNSKASENIYRIPREANVATRDVRPKSRPPATPPTITLKHLAAAIADEQKLSKKQAETILNDMVIRITKHLKKGERVRIVGLGLLQVRKRAARVGRNPFTGEVVRIKASKKVAFRAAKELKEKM